MKRRKKKRMHAVTFPFLWVIFIVLVVGLSVGETRFSDYAPLPVEGKEINGRSNEVEVIG